MDRISALRKEVKQAIENADERLLKIVHAMLVADADSSWWIELPHDIRNNLGTALEQSEMGQVVPHSVIKKRSAKWLAK